MSCVGTLISHSLQYTQFYLNPISNGPHSREPNLRTCGLMTNLWTFQVPSADPAAVRLLPVLLLPVRLLYAAVGRRAGGGWSSAWVVPVSATLVIRSVRSIDSGSSNAGYIRDRRVLVRRLGVCGVERHRGIVLRRGAVSREMQ